MHSCTCSPPCSPDHFLNHPANHAPTRSLSTNSLYHAVCGRRRCGSRSTTGTASGSRS
jgi:hypothetical protein